MGVIGIVVNPNSGKDIRRLVTHATVIDNHEKINIVQRIITGALCSREHQIYINPDRSRLGKRAAASVEGIDNIDDYVTIEDMFVLDKEKDTVKFVDKVVNEYKADVLVVLGGDGTNRAAAKKVGNVPLIPVSTGTNNVYPSMVEGTAVGLAASAIASGIITDDEIPTNGKLIEITVNDERHDIALIDAVYNDRNYVGTRALLNEREIFGIIASQCHPSSIGFSALAGSVEIVTPKDDHGLFILTDWDKNDYIASISAGTFSRFGIKEKKILEIDEEFTFYAPFDGSIGVDGEREIVLMEGDKVTLKITKNGPRKVDVFSTITLAAQKGFFKIKE